MIKPQCLVIAFSCRSDGISEPYIGFKWVQQIARFCEVTLVTTGEPMSVPGITWVHAPTRFQFSGRLLRLMNREMQFDYYWFNSWTRRRFSQALHKFAIVHQLNPMGPRYPCALAPIAKRYVLGPLGGGLRVPAAFRDEVEGLEPLFYRLRNLDGLRMRFDPWLRRTYRAAKLILGAGRYLLKVLPIEFHRNYRVLIDTGVELADYKYVPRAAAGGDAKVKLIYAGRVVPYKGLLYALRALESMPEAKRKRFAFTVVGDRGEGRYELQCKDFVREHGLHGIVTFAGFKKRQEIIPMYENSDLCVFPTLSEAGGAGILEPMAVGRPVLTVNYGAPAEIVTQETGYLLEAQTPKQLVADLVRVFEDVLANPGQLCEKGAAARRLVESRFAWNRKGETLQQWYQELLAQ